MQPIYLQIKPSNGATVYLADGTFVHHFSNAEDAAKMVALHKERKYVIPAVQPGAPDHVFKESALHPGIHAVKA